MRSNTVVSNEYKTYIRPTPKRFFMDAMIGFAIENKRLLSFTYDGYYRIVEPHCFGLTTKNHPAIRAFQVEGQSSTGRLDWKIYELSKIENLQLLEQSFMVPRSGYKKGDKSMSQIFLEL
jgi:hypothetical protein